VKAPESSMVARTKQEQMACNLSSLNERLGRRRTHESCRFGIAARHRVLSSRRSGRHTIRANSSGGNTGDCQTCFRTIRRRLVREPARRAGAISRSPGQDRRSLYGRRRNRHGGARARPAALRIVEAAGHRREQGRRRRFARRRLRGQVGARRLHAVVFRFLAVRDQPAHLREASVRSAEGSGAGRARCPAGAGARGQQPSAGPQRRGVPRPCARESRQAHLCFARRRQLHALWRSNT
jgi:hypothetical protein